MNLVQATIRCRLDSAKNKTMARSTHSDLKTTLLSISSRNRQSYLDQAPILEHTISQAKLNSIQDCRMSLQTLFQKQTTGSAQLKL
jgi:hypothetical protein